MKKVLISFLILTGFIFGLSGISQAKWWIFGKNADGIRINYLYMNKISFDNSVDPSITMFKGNLIDGNIFIKGKAIVSSGKIGAVQVTLDNKETWNKASLSQNGSFEFIFTPEINKTYKIFIKILDTTGKSNDVDATYKSVKVTDIDVSDLVRKSLDQLFEAYQEQNPSRFMQYVSPYFEPDENILDTAIRKDFNTFDHIQIQYVINTVVTGSQNRIYVSLNYNRSVVATKSGELLSDNSATEFVFAMDQNTPKLARIKNPLLFGLSDASNLATGAINSGTNDRILLVNEYGDVQQKPFRDAIDIIESGNSFSESGNSFSGDSGTFTVVAGINLVAGYPFEYNGVTPSELNVPAGSYSKFLGTANIDGVTSVTVLPTDTDPFGIFPAASQNSVAVRFPDGKYMLLQHTAGSLIGATVKYRLSGSSTF